MFPLQPGTSAPPRVQVVVAHPDDETFGCGSLLLHASAVGAVTSVVCATRGEAGQVADGVTVPAGGLAALREAELRRAARLLGVQEVVLLGLTDSGMDGPPGPGTLVGSDPATVRAAVAAAVAGFEPDVLVTLDGGDGHRDHARVRDLTVEVAADAGLPVFLHCLPRSVMTRWLEHARTADPDTPYLDAGQLGTPDEQVSVVVDTTEHLAARWAAIRAHRSQTSPFEGLPDELARAFLCSDHLIEVAPADRTTGRLSP